MWREWEYKMAREYTPQEREKAMAELRASAVAKFKALNDKPRDQLTTADIATLTRYKIGGTAYSNYHKGGLGESDSLVEVVCAETGQGRTQWE